MEPGVYERLMVGMGVRAVEEGVGEGEGRQGLGVEGWAAAVPRLRRPLVRRQQQAVLLWRAQRAPMWPARRQEK